MRTPATSCLAVAFAGLVFAVPASAQIMPGPDPVTGTLNAAQTLTTGTGTINPGGAIIIVSGSAVPLTMNGTSTLINNGTIQTFGSGRALDSNTAGVTLTITSSGLISSFTADAVAVRQGNASVSLTNSGTIQVTNGGQAIDWASITTGSNVLTNQATGVITAVAEDAVRPGQNGIITNAGTITASPTVSLGVVTGSDRINLRTEKNVTVTNTGTITGRHGIATDGANVGPSSLTVQNNAGTIQALNGSGLNVDANPALPSALNVTATVINAVGAIIKGGVLAAATEADGDGIDIDGVLTLTNSGSVLGLGAKGPSNAEGIAAGGGSISNTATGQIVGSTLAADAPNGDTARAGNGILIDNSNGGSAIAATTVTNSGLIEGKSGFGIAIIGTFDDTVTNNAGGTIRGAGSQYAVQTGDGGDTVTNRGAITGTGGQAIDLQAGNDTLKVEGGVASITGSITGGLGSNTFLIDPGAGNGFTYGGTISMFGTVEVTSGQVTFTGVSDYTGTTRLTGGRLTLQSANLLSSASFLDLNGGTLEIANALGLNGQTFAGFGLSTHSTIDLGFSRLTFDTLGAIGGAQSLTILEYLTGPDGYAFRLPGDYSSDAAFLSLLNATTIDGGAAGFRVDSAYTYVAPASSAQPVPEPSTIVLIGLSGLPLLAMRRCLSRLASRR